MLQTERPRRRAKSPGVSSPLALADRSRATGAAQPLAGRSDALQPRTVYARSQTMALQTLKPRLAELGRTKRDPTKPGWHATQAEKTTTERGYGAAWRRAREQALSRDCGLCQVCARAGRVTLAAEVDHITPKFEGGTDHPANLQAICKPCHRTKTEAESRRAAGRC